LINRKEIVDEIKERLSNFDILSTGLYGSWEYKWSDQAYFDTQQETKKFLEMR